MCDGDAQQPGDLPDRCPAQPVQRPQVQRKPGDMGKALQEKDPHGGRQQAPVSPEEESDDARLRAEIVGHRHFRDPLFARIPNLPFLDLGRGKPLILIVDFHVVQTQQMSEFVGERTATRFRVRVLLHEASRFRVAVEVRHSAGDKTRHPVDQKYIRQCSGRTPAGKHIQHQLVARARAFCQVERRVENERLFQVELNVGGHPDSIGNTQRIGGVGLTPRCRLPLPSL
jgi:hypothetical protein